MNIAVFGLGYVGCVSLGCLANNGHTIVGVDIDEFKVDLINSGKPTIIEKDIDRLVFESWQIGRIKATNDFMLAVESSDIAFICVGTPNIPSGQLNLDYVFNTARQIGEALENKAGYYIVAIRSTVLPGTNEKFGRIIEEISGRTRNKDFAVVSNPEFLREGSAVDDFYNPAITVLGSDSEKALNLMEEVYKGIYAPISRTDISVAELIKYVNNTFHALKISFSNEIGSICKGLEIDSFKVMELFKMDNRLNISPTYFNPGMAYGGSCLPKDLKGLSTIAHDLYIKIPVIDAIEQSNILQKERALHLVQKQNHQKIGLLGLAFKKGTDDLRYSPSVELVERLLGKGYDVKVFDKNVLLARLTGANKSFIEEHLPHISSLLVDDFKDLVNEAQTIIVAHKPDPEETAILNDFKGTIIDLVKIDIVYLKADNYEGLSW